MLLDNIVLGILIIFFLIGYKKGVISEFISFSALLFNIVLSKEMTPYIVQKINLGFNNKFYDIFVYVAVFFLTYGVFSIIIKFMLKTVMGKERLFIDKMLGAILGLTKAILITILILLVLTVISKFDVKAAKVLNESKIYGISDKVTESTMLFLPTEIKDMLEKFEYESEIEKAIEKSLGGKTNEKN